MSLGVTGTLRVQPRKEKGEGDSLCPPLSDELHQSLGLQEGGEKRLLPKGVESTRWGTRLLNDPGIGR